MKKFGLYTGKNIFGATNILHGKTKEEIEIRLFQIQKAIDEQKAQTHD